MLDHNLDSDVTLKSESVFSLGGPKPINTRKRSTHRLQELCVLLSNLVTRA